MAMAIRVAIYIVLSIDLRRDMPPDDTLETHR